MSTKITKTCDRCGMEIPRGPHEPECYIADTQVEASAKGRTFDLCMDCRKDLYAFMTSPEHIEPKEGTFGWVLNNSTGDGCTEYRRESCRLMRMRIFGDRLHVEYTHSV